MKDVEQFLNIGFPSKIYVKLNRIIHAILFKINVLLQLSSGKWKVGVSCAGRARPLTFKVE